MRMYDLLRAGHSAPPVGSKGHTSQSERSISSTSHRNILTSIPASTATTPRRRTSVADSSTSGSAQVSNMPLTRHCISMTAVACFVVLILHSMARPLYAGVRRPVTLEDLASLKYVYWHLEVSPDDKTLAYVIDEEDSLWLVGMKGGLPRRIGQGTMPRWSPDGSRLAFYSTRSGALQLWVLDLNCGEAVQTQNI